MRLFIAEKPSLAKAIAAALPGAAKRNSKYIECGSDDVVVWCVGHILEQAPPEAYNPEWKKWRVEDLPIVPTQWQLVPKIKEILGTIKKLLKKATSVVNAGDPDREGQLLVDEVLEYLGYQGPVSRVWIADLNKTAVMRALQEITPNSQAEGLRCAALARQRADWILGMNLTRLYSVKARQLVSVGRVQTPLLGLIARRDREIDTFTPRAFYNLAAELKSAEHGIRAKWRALAAHSEHLDSDGRLIDLQAAKSWQEELQRVPAQVVSAERQPKKQAPPLPYRLSDLQVDAGKKLGLSAQQVLDACQGLYETHKATTYPRSDCRHLPEGHFADAPAVLGALGKGLPELSSYVEQADPAVRSAAWNDKKVTAHHALIPTPKVPDLASMSEEESRVYTLIAQRYVAQFMAKHEYEQTVLEFDVGGHKFTANGRRVVSNGWKDLLAGDSESKTDSDDPLPLLQVGEELSVQGIDLQTGKTTPPKRFTDATLIQAMEGIGKYVSDPKIKKMLSDTQGLGTPATQAATIETLFERAFIEKKGKEIRATATGQALVTALPEVVTTPDMTVLWEAAMTAVEKHKMTVEEFVRRISIQVEKLVGDAAHVSMNLPPPAHGNKKTVRKKAAKKRTRKKRA